MIDKVKKTIQKHTLIKKGEHIVVGVSGGPDSVCLLHILYKLKEEYHLDLSVVHIHHMLREEAADEDEAYVQSLCVKLGISYYSFKINVKEISSKLGISIEEAGRKARYDTLNEILSKVNGSKIAIAQNMNDQGETLLMRLIRGSGLDGLSGMDYIREGVMIRPLLDITRHEIEHYCQENNLQPQTDLTNLQPVYTRNKIRIELIPYMEENFNTKVVQHLWKTANILREDKDFIYSYVDNIFEKHVFIKKNLVKINKNFFLKEHPAVQKRLILKAAHQLKVQKNIGTVHLQDALDLIKKNITSTGIDLPFGLRIKIGYEHIVMSTMQEKILLEMDYDIPIGKTIYVKEIGAHINSKIIKRDENFQMFNKKDIKFFDYDKMQRGIKLRTRKSGDQFSPLGMRGTKKLKNFFIDEKIDKDIRGSIPLVSCGADILWVVGYRISEKYKVDYNTKNVLVLEMKR